MPSTRSYMRSFAGGEVTPEFFGRIDDVKNQTGLQTCRNFIVKPHGPVANRGGLRFVSKAKTADAPVRLLRFVYSSEQSNAIEMGGGYFRFHTEGATLLTPAADAWDSATAYAIGELAAAAGTTYYCIKAHTNQAPPNATYWYAIPSTAYEIPHPYAAADLAKVRYVQSNDVMTLVHPSYPPAELRRYGTTRWVYTPIAFVSALTPPTSVSATAKRGNTSPGTPSQQTYVVSSVNGSDESAASGTAA